MGLLKSLKNAVTGPVRAIGKLARGKVGGAIGALGDTVKPAAFVLGATGVGAPIAAGVGALGGAMQKADDPGAKFGDYLKGAAQGASIGAGGSTARGLYQGIASKVAGAGAVSPPGVPGSVMPSDTASIVGGNVPGGAQSISGTGQFVDAAKGAANLAGGAPPVAPTPGQGIGSKIGSFLSKPEVAVGLGQTLASGYGGYEQGKAAQERLDLDKLEAERHQMERDRRFKLDRNQVASSSLIGMMNATRPRF
jgi:hypothetical protein